MTGADHGGGHAAGRVETAVRLIAVVSGVVLVALGLWAFVAPRSFFDAMAVFEPYNGHFVRDIGAFQIGLGAVLLSAAVLRDALVVALGGVGIGMVFHTVSHVIDRDAGGNPTTDVPLFAVTAVLLLGAAVVRGATRTSTRQR